MGSCAGPENVTGTNPVSLPLATWRVRAPGRNAADNRAILGGIFFSGAFMKIEIKCRFSGSVLFVHDAEHNSIAITLEAAVKARANLARANLARANLDGANLARANLDGANRARANLAGANLARANLDGANLDGANLDGANLARANLDWANLARANLARANLDGANLDWANLARANLARANLDGANLDGKEKLIGKRPILQIGPIGSRCAYLQAFITDGGIRIRAGCFFGSKERFVEKVQAIHGDNDHAAEYMAALSLIDKHADLWTPAQSTQSETPEQAVTTE